jgi:hypothetical protein
MPRPRGIKPQTTTLALSDGDSILIKARLTAGEERDITGLSIKGYTQGADGRTRIEPDPTRLMFVTAAIYLVGWSLIGQDGQPIFWPAQKTIDERIAVLRQLDVETLKEIEEALTKYREAQAAVLEGNAKSDGSGPGAPSPSVM